jgi:transmembrane sensor
MNYMQEKHSPEDLIKKYCKGTCNEQEKAIVESWHLNDLAASNLEPSAQDINSAYLRGRRAIIAHANSGVRKLWPRIAAAASILVFLGIGTYLYSTQSLSPTAVQNARTDIAPGGNRAILTLSNGKQISLNGAKNGELALQGNVSVNKTSDGSLSYRPSANQLKKQEVAYNSISTPIGGQYHLTLEDGTNVWLNSASAIKYPTLFTGGERKVEVTGEVYFEVTHNALKPFRVVTGKQVVEVLGTHFNINAYADEAGIKTTLVEGAVRVSTGNSSMVIKPGQQSVVQNEKLHLNGKADINEAVAWKNGYFQFKDEKMESVMRKLSRWYNIELKYEGESSSEEGFNGTISRSKNISQVLKMLERTKAVHFKIEGRRVIIQ